MPMPNFFTSPYFVPEVDNWHLTPDAPEDVKREFDEYMKQSDRVTVGDDEDEEDYLIES